MFWTTLLFGAWWSARFLLAQKGEIQCAGQARSAPSPIGRGVG
jgi:hypothetical protein